MGQGCGKERKEILTLVSGNSGRLMAMESIHGPTVIDMKVNLKNA
jgi:hypothetical protein